MFDPMLFSPSVQLSLGPSSETFSATSGPDSGSLFSGDDMRLSGPPASSDTMTMSAHRSLFSSPPGGGLKRSMSHAVLNEVDPSFDLYSLGSSGVKEEKIGVLNDKDKAPGPSPSVKPLKSLKSLSGLRSSASCPDLQQLQGSDNDKIKKRKARKAEVARQCRKRKKAYIQSLEEKAKALADQLSALSSKRHKGNNHAIMSLVDKHRNEQHKLLDKMQKLVNRASSGDDVTRELKSCITSFSNNSRKRQKVNVQQLHALRENLNPGLDTKFAIWMLTHGSQLSTSGPFKQLASEVKITKAQMNKLNSHRSRARELRNELGSLIQQVGHLQKEISRHLSKRHSILDQISNKVLNPKQTAKLLLWVQNNPSCMEVLETVWKTQAKVKTQNPSKKEEKRISSGSRGKGDSSRNAKRTNSNRAKREKLSSSNGAPKHLSSSHLASSSTVKSSSLNIARHTHNVLTSSRSNAAAAAAAAAARNAAAAARNASVHPALKRPGDMPTLEMPLKGPFDTDLSSDSLLSGSNLGFGSSQVICA